MTRGIPSGKALAPTAAWEPWEEDELALDDEPQSGGRAAATLIGAFDAGLRRFHRVSEFTQDPRCILRVGQLRARSTVLLADGTPIYAGDPIGVLHFWNEHLHPFSARGPDLTWAKTMIRHTQLSLRQLARHVETDPAWRDVKALHACAPLSARRRKWRAAGRFGFELATIDRTLLRSASDLADSFVAFALTLAFNPAALRRQAFLRHRHELWMSRQILLSRYGADSTARQEM